jgi:hypothetical protein
LFTPTLTSGEATAEGQISLSKWILSITLSINPRPLPPQLAGSRLPAIVLRDRLRQQIQDNTTSSNVTLG